VFPAPSLEVHATVETDSNLFLDSPLLRCSLYEEIIAANIVKENLRQL
jgi:hypothetical protein